MSVTSLSPEPPDKDEPPPFLRTWHRIYAAVVVYLILLISLLAFVTSMLGAN